MALCWVGMRPWWEMTWRKQCEDRESSSPAPHSACFSLASILHLQSPVRPLIRYFHHNFPHQSLGKTFSLSVPLSPLSSSNQARPTDAAPGRTRNLVNINFLTFWWSLQCEGSGGYPGQWERSLARSGVWCKVSVSPIAKYPNVEHVGSGAEPPRQSLHTALTDRAGHCAGLWCIGSRYHTAQRPTVGFAAFCCTSDKLCHTRHQSNNRKYW